MNIASAVEQGVNAVHRGHLRLDSRFVHHIQHGGVDVVHALESLQQSRIDVGRPHRCALGHHGQHRCLANALTGRGDEYVFAL